MRMRCLIYLVGGRNEVVVDATTRFWLIFQEARQYLGVNDTLCTMSHILLHGDIEIFLFSWGYRIDNDS